MQFDISKFQFASPEDVVFDPVKVPEEQVNPNFQPVKHSNETSLATALKTDHWLSLKESGDTYNILNYLDREVDKYRKNLNSKRSELNADEFLTLYSQGEQFKKLALGQAFGIQLDQSDTKEERQKKLDDLETVVSDIEGFKWANIKGVDMRTGNSLNEAFSKSLSELSDHWDRGQDSLSRNVVTEAGLFDSRNDYLRSILYDYTHLKDNPEFMGQNFNLTLQKNLRDSGVELNPVNQKYIDSLAQRALSKIKDDRDIEGVGTVVNGFLNFDQIEPREQLKIFKDRNTLYQFLQSQDLSSEEIVNTMIHGEVLKNNLLSNSVSQFKAAGEDIIGENDYEEFRDDFLQKNPDASLYDIVVAYSDQAAEAGIFTDIENIAINPFARGVTSAGKSLLSGINHLTAYYTDTDITKQAVNFLAQESREDSIRDSLTDDFLKDFGGYGTVAAVTKMVTNAAGQSAPFVAAGLLSGGSAGVPAIGVSAAGRQTALEVLKQGLKATGREALRGSKQIFTGKLSKGQLSSLVNASLEGMSIYGNTASDHYNALIDQGKTEDEALQTSFKTAIPGALVGAALTAAIGGVDGKGLVDIQRIHPNLRINEALGQTSIRDLFSIVGSKTKMRNLVSSTLTDDFYTSLTSALLKSESAMLKGFKGSDILKQKFKSSVIEFAEEGLEEGLAGGLSDALSNVLISMEGVERDTSFGALVEGVVKEALIGGAAGKLMMAPAKFAQEIKTDKELQEALANVKETVSEIQGVSSNPNIENLKAIRARAKQADLPDTVKYLDHKISEVSTSSTSSEAEVVAPSVSRKEAQATNIKEQDFSESGQSVEQTLASIDNAKEVSLPGQRAKLIEDEVKKGQHPIFGFGEFPRTQRNASVTSINKKQKKSDLVENGELKGKLENHTLISDTGNQISVLARQNTSGPATDLRNAVNTDRVIDIKFDNSGNITSVSNPKPLTDEQKSTLSADITDSLLTEEQAKESVISSLPEARQDRQEKFTKNRLPVSGVVFDQLSQTGKNIAAKVNDTFKRTTPVFVDGKETERKDAIKPSVAVSNLTEKILPLTDKLSEQESEILTNAINEAVDKIGVEPEVSIETQKPKKQQKLSKKAQTGKKQETKRQPVSKKQTVSKKRSIDEINAELSQVEVEGVDSTTEPVNQTETTETVQSVPELEQNVEPVSQPEVTETTFTESAEVEEIGVSANSPKLNPESLSKEEFDKTELGKRLYKGSNLIAVHKDFIDGEYRVFTVTEKELRGYQNTKQLQKQVRGLIGEARKGDVDSMKPLSAFVLSYTQKALGQDQGFNSDVQVKLTANETSKFTVGEGQPHTVSIGLGSVFREGFSGLQLSEYLLKSINEEVTHAATYKSFLQSYESEDLAYEALAQLGDSILDNPEKTQFLREAYGEDGLVNSTTAALEFLNGIIQRSNTGFTTSDIAKYAPKRFTQKVKDTIYRYLKAFKNALTARAFLTDDKSLREQVVAITETLAAWSNLNITQDSQISDSVNKRVESLLKVRNRTMSIETSQEIADSLKNNSPVLDSVSSISDSETVFNTPEVVRALDTLSDVALFYQDAGKSLSSGQVFDLIDNENVMSPVVISDGKFIPAFNPELLPRTQKEAASYAQLQSGDQFVSIPARYKFEQALATLNRYKVVDALQFVDNSIRTNPYSYVSPEIKETPVKSLAVDMMLNLHGLGNFSKEDTRLVNLRKISALTKSNSDYSDLLQYASLTPETRDQIRNVLSSQQVQNEAKGFIESFSGVGNPVNSSAFKSVVTASSLNLTDDLRLQAEQYASLHFKYGDVLPLIGLQGSTPSYAVFDQFPDDLNPHKAISGYQNVNDSLNQSTGVDIRFSSRNDYGVIEGIDFTDIYTISALDASITKDMKSDSKTRARTVVHNNIANQLVDAHVNGEESRIGEFITEEALFKIGSADGQFLIEDYDKFFKKKGKGGFAVSGNLKSNLFNFTQFVSLPKLNEVDLVKSAESSIPFFSQVKNRVEDAYKRVSDLNILDKTKTDFDNALEQLILDPNAKTLKNMFFATYRLNHDHIGIASAIGRNFRTAQGRERGQSVSMIFMGETSIPVIEVVDQTGFVLYRKEVLSKTGKEEKKEAENWIKQQNESVDNDLKNRKLTIRESVSVEMQDPNSENYYSFALLQDLKFYSEQKNEDMDAYLTHQIFFDKKINLEKTSLKELLLEMDMVPESDFNFYSEALKKLELVDSTDPFKRLMFDGVSGADIKSDKEDTYQILQNVQKRVDALRDGLKFSIKRDASAPMKRTLLAYYLFDGDFDKVQRFFTTVQRQGTEEKSLGIDENGESLGSIEIGQPISKDDVLAQMVAERIKVELEEISKLDSFREGNPDSPAANAINLLLGKEAVIWSELEGKLGFHFRKTDNQSVDSTLQGLNKEEFLGFVGVLQSMRSPVVVKFSDTVAQDLNSDVSADAEGMLFDNLGSYSNVPVILYRKDEFDKIVSGSNESKTFGNVGGGSTSINFSRLNAQAGPVLDSDGNLIAFLQYIDSDSNLDNSRANIKNYIISEMSKEYLSDPDKKQFVSDFLDLLKGAYKSSLYSRSKAIVERSGTDTTFDLNFTENQFSETESQLFFGLDRDPYIIESYAKQFEKVFGDIGVDKDLLGDLITPEDFISKLFTDPEVYELLTKVDTPVVKSVPSVANSSDFKVATSYVDNLVNKIIRSDQNRDLDAESLSSVDNFDVIDNTYSDLDLSLEDIFDEGIEIDEGYSQLSIVSEQEQFSDSEGVFVLESARGIKTRAYLTELLADIVSSVSIPEKGLSEARQYKQKAERRPKKGVSLMSFFNDINNGVFINTDEAQKTARTHYRNSEPLFRDELNRFKQAITQGTVDRNSSFIDFLQSNKQGQLALDFFANKNHKSAYKYLEMTETGIEQFLPTPEALANDQFLKRKALEKLENDSLLSEKQTIDLENTVSDIDSRAEDAQAYAAREYLNQKRIVARNERQNKPFSYEQSHKLSQNVVLERTETGFGFGGEKLLSEMKRMQKGMNKSVSLNSLEAITFNPDKDLLQLSKIEPVSVNSPVLGPVSSNIVSTGSANTRSIIPGLDMQFSKKNKQIQLAVRSDLYKRNTTYAELTDREKLRVKREGSDSVSVGGIKEQIDAKIANLVAIAQAKSTHGDAKNAALSALRKAKTGDLAGFEQYSNYALSYGQFQTYVNSVNKAVSNKRFGEKEANLAFVHMDASLNQMMPRDAAARKFLDRVMTMVDFGFSIGTGRNGFFTKKEKSKLQFEKLVKNLTEEQEQYATALGYVLNYSLNENSSGIIKSARIQLSEVKDFLEQSMDQMQIGLDSERSTNAMKKQFKSQIKQVTKLVSNVDKLIQSSESVFDSNEESDVVDSFEMIQTTLFKDLNQDQKTFITESRKIFDSIRPDVQAATQMNGFDIGQIENYLPMTSFDVTKDDPLMGLGDEQSFVKPSHSNHVRTRDIANDKVNALNLQGSKIFARSFNSMLYNTNTRSVYSMFSTMFGVEDPDTGDHLQNSLYYQLHKAAVGSEAIDPNLYEGMEFFRNWITNLLERDRHNSSEDSSLRKVMSTLTGLGVKQALTSLHQPIKQTLPIIGSFFTRNMFSPMNVFRLAKNLSRLVVGGTQSLIGFKSHYRDNLVDAIETFAPHIAQRQADAIDFSDSSLKKLINTQSVLGIALYVPAKLADFIVKSQSLLLKAVLEKPDTWLVRGILDTEYQSITGVSLADTPVDQVDLFAFRHAQKTVEGSLAQSDQSKKGSMLQKHEKFYQEALRLALLAFSNHTISVGSTARSGFSLILNSESGSDNIKEGLGLIVDIVAQNLIFRSLSVGTIAYFIGQALGDDESEEQEIEKSVLEWIGNDQLFIEQRTRKQPMTDEQFVHRFVIPLFTDSLQVIPGATGTLASIGFTNKLIQENLIGGAVQDLFGIDRFEPEDLIMGSTKEGLGFFGPSTIPVTNMIDYVSAYTQARDEYNVGYEDLMFALYQLVGFRESRSVMSQAIKKRNNTPVFSSESDRRYSDPEWFFEKIQGVDLITTPDQDQSGRR